MHRPHAAILILAIAALVGGSDRAADSPLSPPDLERYLRWGPLRARPGFEVKNLGYDSNVLNSPEEISDVKGTLAPSLEGLVLFGDRAFLTFDEELRYTAYATNTDLNYFDQVGDARLTVPFGSFGVFGDIRYDRIRNPPVDLDDIRPIQELTEIGVGAIAEFGWRTTVEYRRASGRRRNFDDDFGQVGVPIEVLLDRDEITDTLTTRYKAFGRTVLSLELEQVDTAFDIPNINGEPGFDRDATSWSVLPGIRLRDARQLSGSVRLGRARLDHVGDAIRDFSGWVGDADLLYRPGGSTRIRVAAERRVDFSVYQGNEYYVYDEGRVNAVHYLTRIFGLEGEIGRGSLEIPGIERIDWITRYKAGIRIRMPETKIGRRAEYRIAVGRYSRDSNDDRFDRSRGTFAIDIVFGY